ncbi:MAG: ribosome maturation factor RimP [Eubacteriaceae bacterium]|jgi:ribosome maturation factor RimP|nr:ribosome maturation factor RimP [Eubacteriaceae bacterium]
MAQKLLGLVIGEALPILEECECELVDSECKKEGGETVMRFYVERLAGSISLDDCTEINRRLSERLDQIDTGAGSFILEISSPGVERPLKKPADYRRFMGSEVDVSLYKALNGRKKLLAVLSGFDEEKGELAFHSEGEEIALSLRDIAKINLHFSF